MKKVGIGKGLDWNKVSEKALLYCEEHGICELIRERGNVITYYSYFGHEGFVRVEHNLKTGKEKRKCLRYKWNNPPKFLITPEGYTLYNYFCG